MGQTRSNRSWLPPHGWWERIGPKRTVIRGWDWRAGCLLVLCSTQLLPMVGGPRNALVAFVVSLLLSAGAGWRVVVDARGTRFDWTWLCIPIRGAGFSRAARVERQLDDDWDAGGVWFHDRARDVSREFGSKRAALEVVYAIRRAAYRHQLPEEGVFSGGYR